MDRSEVFREHGFGLSCLFNIISTEQVKEIFDLMPYSVFIVNPNGQILYVNKRGLELNGIEYSGFEMEKNISMLKALRPDGSPFPPEDMPVSLSLKSVQVIHNVEMIIENFNGIRYQVNVSSAPMIDNHGKMSGAVVIFEDFTVHQQKAKERVDCEAMILKAAEEKYNMIFNSIDQGFFLIDVIFDENDRPIDMYYVESNDAATKMLGSDYTGHRLRDIDPNYEEYWFEIFGKVALTGQSMRMEQYAHPDKKWYSFYIFRIGNEKSRRIGNVFLDITAHKQAQEALKESEQLYRTLFENSIDGFVIVEPIFDESGHSDNYLMVNVNQSWEKQTGLKAEDFIGKTIQESMPGIESSWPQAFANVAKTGESLRFESFNHISNRWYDLYAFNYKEGHVGVLFRDISDQKKLEEELHESENRYRTMFETSGEGIVYSTQDGICLYCNRRFADMLGYSQDEIPGKTSEDLNFSSEQPQVLQIREALNKGSTINGEFRFRRKDGSELWTMFNSTPVFNAAGEIVGNFAMHTDIKERKKVDKVLQESESRAHELVRTLEEEDKNKNEFINALSHELRNPLAAISAGLQILDITQAPDQTLKAKRIINRQMSQLCHLVDDLLDCTRIKHNKINIRKEVIELNSLAFSVAEDNRPLYEDKGVKLITDIKGGSHNVNVDPIRIKQIIGNLLTNALKFSNEGGVTVMSVYTENNESVISVKDTGIGISSEILRNMFNPFIQADTSLDRHNGGLGLGLSIAKGIAELHSGSVSAFSEGLGKGSTFEIRLPLYKNGCINS